VHADGDATVREPRDQLVDVSMHQRLTTIQMSLSHPKIMKLSQRFEHLVMRHLMG